MRYTVSPLLGRALLPKIIRRLFAPAPVTEGFQEHFPKELMLRPSQLRAAAADTALMIPAATELQPHYGELEMPVVIVTGADDQIVDVGRQSQRLHAELPGSEFTALPGLGHMVHHLAPDQVANAVDHAADSSTAAHSAA